MYNSEEIDRQLNMQRHKTMNSWNMQIPNIKQNMQQTPTTDFAPYLQNLNYYCWGNP